MVKVKRKEDIQKLLQKPEKIRNASIIAHVDHGKTALSDNLLAAAGMISKEKAGIQLELDKYILEQQRKMTIFASYVSLIHEYGFSRAMKTDYVILCADCDREFYREKLASVRKMFIDGKMKEKPKWYEDAQNHGEATRHKVYAYFAAGNAKKEFACLNDYWK